MHVLAVGNLFISFWSPNLPIQKYGLSLPNPKVGGLEHEVT